jgi:hypothetical protein
MRARTLPKILEHSEPPGYRQKQPRPRKKLEAYVGRIEQILKGDQALPRKQRHTAKRTWERSSEQITDTFTDSGHSARRNSLLLKQLKLQARVGIQKPGWPNPPGNRCRGIISWPAGMWASTAGRTVSTIQIGAAIPSRN